MLTYHFNDIILLIGDEDTSTATGEPLQETEYECIPESLSVIDTTCPTYSEIAYTATSDNSIPQATDGEYDNILVARTDDESKNTIPLQDNECYAVHPQGNDSLATKTCVTSHPGQLQTEDTEYENIHY